VHRIVQEALTNILKHAVMPSRATVVLRYSPALIEIDVRDNGSKVDTTDADGRGDRVPGHGLVGMRERAAVYGGTVRAGPQPGGGWRVIAALPSEAMASQVADQ
jgi:signal transduction histidine kinase